MVTHHHEKLIRSHQSCPIVLSAIISRCSRYAGLILPSSLFPFCKFFFVAKSVAKFVTDYG
jgi:hypothetical protein